MPGEAACIHHWICGDASPAGYPSLCRKCGERKNFPLVPRAFTEYTAFTVAPPSEPFAHVRFGAHHETGLAW